MCVSMRECVYVWDVCEWVNERERERDNVQNNIRTVIVLGILNETTSCFP